LAHRRDVSEDSIKHAITALPDVQSCKVEFAKDGAISAIHVVTRSRRPAKQIVRDIETILQADFGISVDYRKISVAGLAELAEIKPATSPRPRLRSITFTTTEGKGKCQVVLAREGQEVTGEASGVTAGGGDLRVVASATFRAIERLVSPEVEFEVLDVVELRVANMDTLIVLANYVSGGDVKCLAGCVRFEDNEQRAAVYAALDACNRVVELLPSVERTEYEISPLDEA
jgi:hypothetical protein